jgi:hypothetical protein
MWESPAVIFPVRLSDISPLDDCLGCSIGSKKGFDDFSSSIGQKRE